MHGQGRSRPFTAHVMHGQGRVQTLRNPHAMHGKGGSRPHNPCDAWDRKGSDPPGAGLDHAVQLLLEDARHVFELIEQLHIAVEAAERPFDALQTEQQVQARLGSKALSAGDGGRLRSATCVLCGGWAETGPDSSVMRSCRRPVCWPKLSRRLNERRQGGGQVGQLGGRIAHPAMATQAAQQDQGLCPDSRCAAPRPLSATRSSRPAARKRPPPLPASPGSVSLRFRQDRFQADVGCVSSRSRSGGSMPIRYSRPRKRRAFVARRGRADCSMTAGDSRRRRDCAAQTSIQEQPLPGSPQDA